MKRKYAKIAIALAVAAATATTPVVSVLASEEAVVTSGEAIDGAMVTSGEEKSATQTVGVNYWDVDENKQAGEGEVTVAADAIHVNTSALTDIPEGYELASTGDVEINGGWIYVEVKKVEIKEIGVNYWDVDENKQAGEGKVTVTADAYNVNTSVLTDIPEGYELASTGDVTINDGWIYVEVRKAATTKEIGVNYWDVDENKQAGEGKVTVAADAYNVNTSALTDIPEGYELVNTGDIQINDGWIYVEVKKAATTKEIGVNYWDAENNVQVGEGKVTVAADAYNVNTSALTDIPAGYELTTVGDIQINDGWIYVEVKKAATTKEVGVNYYIAEEDRYVEGTVTVAADAIHVNTSALTDVPAGYEVIWTGDVLINDGWIYVELRKSETVKEVGVNYYIPAEDRYVEGKVIVDKDANNVNTSALTDIPAGYEPIWVGDVQINDGWIYVELRKSETVKEISVKYYIPAEHRYLKGKVIVDKDAIHVNTSALTDIPKGYEPIVVGDIEIKNGWIYVELQKVAERPDKPEKPLINGLHQGPDGIWRYYVNSIFQKDFSGILEYEGNSFVLKNGVLCQDASGLNLVDGVWYFLTEGRIRTDVTQVVMYDGEWFYVSNGKLDTSVNGLVPYDGETFVFVDGRLAQEGNGLWVGEEGVWYFLSNGRVAREHTGLAMYDDEWFYVVNGKIAVDYNGTVEYNGGTFKVVGGMVKEQVK